MLGCENGPVRKTCPGNGTVQECVSSCFRPFFLRIGEHGALSQCMKWGVNECTYD